MKCVSLMLFFGSILILPSFIAKGSLQDEVPSKQSVQQKASTKESTQEKNKKSPFSGLPLFFADTFKADPYITAAIALQDQGEQKSSIVLKEAVKEHDLPVIILCRMLFKSPGKERKFRRPLLGRPEFVGQTESTNWPLEPIEIVDGVPFSLVSHYYLAGLPESGEVYLNYCLSSCEWNTYRYKSKTAPEKQKALDKLIADRNWEKPLSEASKKTLSSQIVEK
jgi:hypothetical protein